jgi:hypothetical protein
MKLLIFIITITLNLNCFSQKIKVLIQSNLFKVIEDKDKYKYSISSKKYNLTNIKYLKILDRGFQIIDDTNKIKYFKYLGEQKIVKYSEEDEPYLTPNDSFNIEITDSYLDIISFKGVCGSVPSYELQIVERDDIYQVVCYKWNFGDQKGSSRYIVLKNIPRLNIEKLAFLKSRSLSLQITSNDILENNEENINDNLSYIFKTNNKFGILYKTAPIYDSIKNVDDLTYVSSNGLHNYYELNLKPKYKILGSFIGYVCPFTTIKGQKGFIDREGKEIY